MDNESLIKKKYEFFDHTADVKFRAYGKNLEEAFSNGALALFSVITDVKKVKGKIEKKIIVESGSVESLLFDFYEELIYLIDTEGFLLSKVKELRIKDENHLTAIIVGDEASKYETFSQLKAMTYHDVIIKKEKNFTMIQVVPDI